jgi:glutamate 5-kinase
MNPELANTKRMVVKVGSALLADEEKGAIRTPWLGNWA